LSISYFFKDFTANSGETKSTGGLVGRVVAVAIQKRRHRSSGIVAAHMRGSRLTLFP